MASITAEQDTQSRQQVEEGRKALQESANDLSNVAEHVRNSYAEAVSSKNVAGQNETFQQAKQYAVQALAAVAYQVNVVSLAIGKVIDYQTDQMKKRENEMSIPHESIRQYDEQCGRRAIAQMAVARKAPRHHKVVKHPTNEPSQQKQLRYGINFRKYDSVGVGGGGEAHAPSIVSPSEERKRQSLRQRPKTNAPPMAPSAPKPMAPKAPQAPQRRNSQVSGMTRPGQQQQQQQQPPQQQQAPPPPSSQPPPPPPGGAAPPLPSGPPPGHGGDAPQPTGAPPPPPPNAPKPVVVHYPSVSEGSQPSKPSPRMARKNVPGSMSGGPPPAAAPPPPPTAPPPMSPTQQDDDLPPPPDDAEDSDVISHAIAVYNYSAQQDDELTFQEDDWIEVVAKNEDGWFEGYIVGTEKRGLFPGNYVEERETAA